MSVRNDPATRAACRSRSLIWDWQNVWPGWRNWLIEGIPADHPLKPQLEIEEIKEAPVEQP